MVAELSRSDRERILYPALVTADLPGVGGRARCRPQDFRVVEIPAYAADGADHAHLLLTLEKTGWNTADAVIEVAKQLSLRSADIGVAGLKDRHAHTIQWISVPYTAHERVATFAHPDLKLGAPQPHRNKLRRGHLHGNSFDLVVRDLAVDVDEAVVRAGRCFEALTARHGMLNAFGDQRFGRDGANLDRGLALLRGGRARRRDQFLLSAGQSGLFNLYLARRAQAGQLRTVLAGDFLQKVETGGSFTCEDPDVDQARLDAGELCITGPIFGAKTRWPDPQSPAAQFELSVLAEAQISTDSLKSLGKNAPGARRPLAVFLDDASVEAAPAAEGLTAGIRVRFGLPSGSYASLVLREIMQPMA